VKRVVCVQECLQSYRVPFFDRLRSRLLQEDVALEVHYGAPVEDVALRGIDGHLPWGTPVRNRRLAVGSAHRAVWQPVVGATRHADLVVVGQESRLLANYVLLARYRMGGPRVALWGHGANLHPDGSALSRAAEVAKRRYSRIPHWWFAYTEGVADTVTGLGFPRRRVTVVQNAVDTSALRGWFDAVTPQEAERMRAEIGLTGHHTCLYLGSLYANKRLDFLIEAGRAVAAAVPGFELVVVGSGPDHGMVARAAATFPWLHQLGPRFGRDKAVLARLSRLMLMPSAVGLGVLDAFALQLPLVTAAQALHGPEFEYLRDGVNGVVTAAGSTAGAYADVVAGLLRDPARLARLKEGCAASATTFTVETMAQRFGEGITSALSARPRVAAGGT
jgi:glycosyltransferase involved in cell wall biosynthesis